MKPVPILPHQQSSIPLELRYRNFRDLLKTKTDRDPDRTFLIFPESERQFTYREFYALTVGAAVWLDTFAPRGGTISIIFRNTPEFLAVYFGAVYLGITVVPINPDLAAREIRFIVENSDSTTVLHDPDFGSKLSAVASEMLPSRTFMPFADVGELPKVDAAAVEASLPDVDPTTPAVIIYTSGTTGNPKGVVLSHMNLITDGKGIAEWFEFSPETRSLCILPLFHNNGLVVSLTTTLYGGGSVVFADAKSSMRSFFRLGMKYNANFSSLMSSVLAVLLTVDYDGPRGLLRGIICGGQLLPLNLMEKFESKFGIPLFEGFGGTEATSYSSFNRYPAELRKPGTVGIPMPISDMKVVDENGVEVADGTEGEICIRGGNVAIGYHNLPELQAKRFRDGWYFSGDYGLRDSEGNYYFRGRRDDLIVKGGEKIYPAEIENVLQANREVVEAAVIGIEDAILGQEICAFVNLKVGSALTERDLQTFCAQSLARFKQPKRIIITSTLGDMPELPKGPTKKVLHRKLRDYYTERIAVENPNNLKWVREVAQTS
jgi:acyl-CoA synthetase (AMP-forming)/AMP-acid ligase II